MPACPAFEFNIQTTRFRSIALGTLLTISDAPRYSRYPTVSYNTFRESQAIPRESQSRKPSRVADSETETRTPRAGQVRKGGRRKTERLHRWGGMGCCWGLPIVSSAEYGCRRCGGGVVETECICPPTAIFNRVLIRTHLIFEFRLQASSRLSPSQHIFHDEHDPFMIAASHMSVEPDVPRCPGRHNTACSMVAMHTRLASLMHIPLDLHAVVLPNTMMHPCAYKFLLGAVESGRVLSTTKCPRVNVYKTLACEVLHVGRAPLCRHLLSLLNSIGTTAVPPRYSCCKRHLPALLAKAIGAPDLLWALRSSSPMPRDALRYPTMPFEHLK